jgi:hypothetical protein
MERAKTIRRECYNPAAVGKTRVRISINQNNGIVCTTYPPAPIVTGQDLVEELMRTMPGCKITHIHAASEDTGYSPPESIEIDWS